MRSFILPLSISILLLNNSYFPANVYAQGSATDHIAAAKAYQSKDAYDDALKELQEIGDISSLDDSAKKLLLGEYISLSDSAIKKASREKALGITGSAFKAFPDEKRVIVKHGKALLAMDKYRDAVSMQGRFLELSGNKSNDAEALALGYAVQGYGMRSVNPAQIANIREMIFNYFQTAISKDPDWYLPYFLLGSAYISVKDYAKAQEYFEKGKTINPNGLSRLDYLFLASLYNEHKQYQKVKDLLKDIPLKHPTWPGVHLYLGYAEEGAGNLTEAFLDYNYEMFISGQDNFLTRGAQQSMANIIREIGGSKEKQDTFPELVNYIKAGSAGAKGDFQESINYYSKIEASNPSPSPILYLLLGEAYMQNKDHNKAISYLQKMVAIDPSFPPAYCEIGDMYAEDGDIDNAILWWERGFATDPDNWKVRYTKERLKKSNLTGQKFSEFLKRNDLI